MHNKPKQMALVCRQDLTLIYHTKTLMINAFGVLIFEPNIDAPSISTCSYYLPLDYIMNVIIAIYGMVEQLSMDML